jgi:pyroglutamyl-peptidase
MSDRPFLVTGFEPYGGRDYNPAHAVMQALHGRRVAGVRIEGRGLPVSFGRLAPAISALIDDIAPVGIICLGLAPGEPVIRLERVGVNVVDFSIPDNEGALCRDIPVRAGAEVGKLATLPMRPIEAALLAEGIPVRLSASAGTFLCNACLYTVLDELDRRGQAIPAGFIHVPYTPEQVSGMLAAARASPEAETRLRADLSSMDLSRIVRGVEIAITVSLAASYAANCLRSGDGASLAASGIDTGAPSSTQSAASSPITGPSWMP